MPDETLGRGRGKLFDQVAAAYDRHRPTYPDRLVDRACEVGELVDGDPVLEIGCGSGQLTRSLLDRGLRVTALEPGAQLLALAREKLRGAVEVQFVQARLEDANLPPGKYQAVFSASAMHWVDPDVGWHRAADALAPGGALALIQYFGLADDHSADDQRALLALISEIAPELAAEWPAYRDLESTVAGALARAENVSAVWSWLGGYAVARPYAADVFDDVQIAAVPTVVEHTADELTALLGTMSFWSRLSPRQRDAVANGNRSLYERLGRPIRASIVACLVTARRAASPCSDGLRGGLQPRGSLGHRHTIRS
jgi:SAM-dependent methyltransferase